MPIPSTLKMFVSIQSFYNEFKPLSSNESAVERDAIATAISTTKAHLINELATIGKKMQVCRKDFVDTAIELGVKVDEETGIMARAILGRWINNSSWEESYLFLAGLLKLNCIMDADETLTLNKKMFGEDLTKDQMLDLAIPCSILFAWSIMIETGVCIGKEVQDKKQYMPPTLGHMIFIEKLSKIYNEVPNKHALQYILGTFYHFFIRNVIRYQTAQPHNSEVIYLTVAKNAYERAGGDPADVLDLCIEGEFQNWTLFQFITANTK